MPGVDRDFQSQARYVVEKKDGRIARLCLDESERTNMSRTRLVNWNSGDTSALMD